MMFYTQYHRMPDSGVEVALGVATSSDLVHWTKLGPVVGHGAGGLELIPRKSASLVTERRGDRLVAARIDGKFMSAFVRAVKPKRSSPSARVPTPSRKKAA